MRCLTLADELRINGASCHFITREQQGDMAEAIRSRKHRVHVLPKVPLSERNDQTPDDPPHYHWLRSGWEHDADQSRSILSNLMPQWLIIDHYGIDHRWEEALSEYCDNMMVIDDLADRAHQCDLLLDQNWHGQTTHKRYNTLVPDKTIKLLGPEYALLRPDYPLLRSLMPRRDGNITRVLVFMGGSDPGNETEKAIKALSSPDLCHLVIDVVLGANHPDPEGIAALCKARSRVNIHQNLPGLAGLMVRADLMVGAGGATTWERMCLGLPSIIISIANNQTPTNRALMEAGFINFLGESSDVSGQDIAVAVRRSLAFREPMQLQSRLIESLVPGDGVAKTVSHLIRS
ncbi:MAG: UDP-2,4-diacetamido-2,4,6-trideoxy-beta-L-altropyranose hydrolase [Marinobacter sp.]|nr:UDP-2,4-diacetamido-2,4,6-trideoxy-beta-L-altropyranose hydrolase [Marinobacter sp.]